MASSDPNTGRRSGDEVVQKATYTLGPDARDLQLQNSDKFDDDKHFNIFLSILLGEDQAPDEVAIGDNKGGASSGTDHDTMQPHGAELVTTSSMTSSDSSSGRRSGDEEVQKATYILGPNARDLQLQPSDTFDHDKQFKFFLSILLGEDQAPDEVVTGQNRGGASSGTDHAIMQPHGAELVSTSTTFWLPAYLKKRGKVSGYKPDDLDDCFLPLKIVYEEVMKFDARAIDVAKVFAKMEIDLVESLLQNPGDLRSMLQGIANDMETVLPIHALSPSVEPITHGDMLQLRDERHDDKMQFHTFYYILLGRGQAPDELATSHIGGGVSSGTDHDTMQPHGAELVPSTTFWLPAYLKKRGNVSGYKVNVIELFQPLNMVYEEVMKFDTRAIDVAKVFAKMDFDHVEYLLENPEDLQSTLQGIVNDMETVLPLHALLPDFEPIAHGDMLLLRDKCHDKQLNIFYSILLGRGQAPDEAATGRNRGGVSSGTDHDTMQPHGADLVSSTTFWFPEYLKKRGKIPGYKPVDCVQPLKMALEEVMKFDARATDVAKVFAMMEIDHVEFLLKNPEDLRSTLSGVVKELETAQPLHALLPDIEPMGTEED